MKHLFFSFLILCSSVTAQKIETIDFVGGWIVSAEENSFSSKDTIVLIKADDRDKQYELKEHLKSQNPETSEVLFLPNRFYFNPNIISCGCRNQNQLLWKWTINIKLQTININVIGKKKNRFKILSFEKSLLINEISLKKLILVKV